MAARKPKKKGNRKTEKSAAPEITTGVGRPDLDPMVAARRRKAVNQLRADGSTLREIADALLTTHMNEGTPLFTFLDDNGHPVTDLSGWQYETLRQRAYDTVRLDVKVHRDEAMTEEPSAVRLADDRYLLAERYRRLFKETRDKMDGERNRAVWNNLCRTAADLAARIGRLSGIETEKPMEIRLPERYRAWIDEDGIVHKDDISKEADDGPAN